jgi:hypothetical protein
VPFFAPEEYRAGDLLLRSLRPGDGTELNRATVSSYEHLREFLDWARPDTSVEESEEYVRRSRARWLLGEEWGLGVWRGERLVAGSGFMLRGRPLAYGTLEIGMCGPTRPAGASAPGCCGPWSTGPTPSGRSTS